jgi:hypothetical protein
MKLITFDQFIAKWLGKKCDFDGHFAGQCVDLYRMYIKEVLGFPQPKAVHGAKDFWYNYDRDPALYMNYTKIRNTLWNVPKKGDVMFFQGGLGHVSMFIDGQVFWFTSFDQNWPTLSKCTKTKHGYRNPQVLGWFRPKYA